jgi:Glycosyltransferase sugar-binding region containing DXD motif
MRAGRRYGSVMRQRFQSFWWGEPLSPYEWLSLKSFADFGHAFDLHTFDPDLVVPSGVRVCDASEIADRNELFVYEEGFGKGSPAAFADVFRYKLLAQKGGWWVDTDVVCLTDNIPDYAKFVARQDVDFVNSAIMLFGPRDPVMMRCAERAAALGRSVRWGDSGARLLTQVLEELEQGDLIQAASVCYPVHYSGALEVLRPSRLGRIAERLGGSIFLHLWNQMLTHSGIRKTYLPPKGSMLRHLVEEHRVGGWSGEYDEAGLVPALQAQAHLSEQLEIQRGLEIRLNRQTEETNRLKSELRAHIAAAAQTRLELEAVLVRQTNESKRLEDELQDRIIACDRLVLEFEAVHRSMSWRVTKPLRALRKVISPAHRTSRRATD